MVELYCQVCEVEVSVHEEDRSCPICGNDRLADSPPESPKESWSILYVTPEAMLHQLGPFPTEVEAMQAARDANYELDKEEWTFDIAEQYVWLMRPDHTLQELVTSEFASYFRERIPEDLETQGGQNG